MEGPDYGSRGLDLVDAAASADYGLPRNGAGDHGDHSATTVRTATHDGHEIRIETTYAITVDGRPLDGALEVLDNGTVHYHGLPQYAVASAIDMVRRVIDYFGTEPPTEDELAGTGHDHPDHGHDHGSRP